MIFARHNNGFTLIELILVVGILAVLLSITLIAINPARQFSQANNTKRQSDVDAILNAIEQYATDNRGIYPPGITTTTTVIGNGSGQLDLCQYLVAKYIAAFPGDPTTGVGTPTTNCGSSYSTRYTVSKSATDNRLTVSAPDAELSKQIFVNR